MKTYQATFAPTKQNISIFEPVTVSLSAEKKGDVKEIALDLLFDELQRNITKYNQTPTIIEIESEKTEPEQPKADPLDDILHMIKLAVESHPEYQSVVDDGQDTLKDFMGLVLYRFGEALKANQTIDLEILCEVIRNTQPIDNLLRKQADIIEEAEKIQADFFDGEELNQDQAFAAISEIEKEIEKEVEPDYWTLDGLNETLREQD